MEPTCERLLKSMTDDSSFRNVVAGSGSRAATDNELWHDRRDHESA
jgi:hypothetical protein